MTWKQIGEIAEVITGSTPKKKNPSYFGGNVPWIKPGDVQNRIDPIINTEETLSELGSAQARILPPGAVLVTCIGEIGRVGITGKPSATNQQINAVVFKEIVLPEFGFYSILYSKAHLEKSSTVTTVPILNKSNLMKVSIPILPIQKQHDLVSKMKRLELAIRLRKDSFELLDSYLQSLFIEMFGDPIANTKKWPTKKMEDIVPEIESGWSPVCEPRPAKLNEKGVLKLGAITWGEYNQNENKALPTSEKFDSSIEVKSGDLLFCRKNTHDLVAAAAYVFETRAELMMSDLIFRLNPSSVSKFSSIFLWRLFVNEHQKKHIQSLATGSSGSMPNISKEKLKKVEIISPPTDLQRQFESKVTATYKLKYKLEKSQLELKSLFASILSESFGGVHS